MKKSEIKERIHKEVRVFYVENDRTIKTVGILHAVNFKEEIAEVWCSNGKQIKVHLSQLKKLDQNIIPLEKRLEDATNNFFSNEEAKNAFKCLLEAYKTLKFYADTRTWIQSTSGKYLGEISSVKWKRAQDTLDYVEKNFI